MNFTVADILGVGAGFLLFGLFGFAPGYTFGRLTDVFQFRERRLATRIALAVPLSIGLMPIAAYLLWHVWIGLVWVLFGLSGAICGVLLVQDWRRLGLRLSRAGWKVVAIAAGWVVVGTFSLIDLQFGNRLYLPFSDYDHSTRVAFTAAIARGGIPPHNPFFFAGQPGLLRYHYFWFIPCALVDRLGGWLVTPRMAVIDGVLWSGLGLMAVIAVYLRFFQAKGGEQIERRTLIAVCLLGITGLDIVPIFAFDYAGHGLLPSIERWNNQISAWITSLLWVPHDLAGLTAGLTGFVLAWEAVGTKTRWRRAAAIAGAGFAFASSSGLSIYVAGTLVAGCLLWLVVCGIKGWWRQAWVLTAAALLALVLLMPWLLQILHGGSAGSSAAGKAVSLPFALGVRTFTIPDLLAHAESPGKVMALNAVLLPLNYFLEFGFFSVIGFLGVRRIWRHGFEDRADFAAAVLGLASVVICTFVSSTIISDNDLAWRSPLIVQFVLLLWAAEMWNAGTLGFAAPDAAGQRRHSKPAPLLITATLLLGAIGSSYELCLQRMYPILWDHFHLIQYRWLSMDKQLGLRTYAMRSSYVALERMLPANAVVQADPRGGIGNLAAELYSGRQMVADSGDCGTVFGGSARYCEDVILPRLKPLFDDRRAVSMGEVEQTCRKFSIAALLFEDTDPVWKDKASWIWKVTPMMSNDYVRVIACDGGVGKSGPE